MRTIEAILVWDNRNVKMILLPKLLFMCTDVILDVPDSKVEANTKDLKFHLG